MKSGNGHSRLGRSAGPAGGRTGSSSAQGYVHGQSADPRGTALRELRRFFENHLQSAVERIILLFHISLTDGV